MALEQPSSSYPPRRRDWGRIVARVLCALFALLGLLPLSLGFIARTDAARAWASQETSRALRESLGLEASYEVSISLLPLQLALVNLQVQSTDGQGPALTADRAAITPRVFALIAGRVDIGDIEIEGAQHRLVIEKGKLTNLGLKLPEASDTGEVERAPFTSLAITDARFNLTIDGVRFTTGVVDIDVFAEKDRAFEIALRANEARVEYPSTFFSDGQRMAPDGVAPPADAPPAKWDSDILCQLDTRVRMTRDGFLVRRLSLMGTADTDPMPGSNPDCRVETEEGEIRGRVAARISQLRVTLGDDSSDWFVHGGLMLRAPVDLLNRFADTRFRGWVGLSGDIRYDGSTKLPSFRGKLRTSELLLGDTRLVEGAEGQVVVEGDKLRLPKLNARYAGGDVQITDTTLAPLEPGMPLRTARVEGTGVSFPKMLRDIGNTPNTIVQWSLDKVVVTEFKGTLDPPRLDSDLYAETSRFQITNKAYHDPNRSHMLGVKPRAVIQGRFGVRPDGVQFNDTVSRFGGSTMYATVHVGFENTIRMTVPESTLDLKDISPLVTIDMQGKAKISAEMNGAAGDPLLTGALSVDDLVFGGFPIGNLEKSKLTFRPLWVEVTEGKITKGGSVIDVPSAKLDFDGPHDVKADALVKSSNLDVQDFMHMWHFQKDPIWRDMRGRVTTSARVRYVLGGPADACGDGNLRVDGNAHLAGLTLFDERYDSASGGFDFNWRDTLAGYHGMRLNLPSVQMKKGKGTILGSFKISEGAKIQGDFVGTAVPLSKLDGLGEAAKLASGTVSATAMLSGSLDELDAQVQASVSPVIMGRSKLPASHLSIHLEPKPAKLSFKSKRTGCGRQVPEPRTTEADELEGEYHIQGHLFGKQVQFDDFSITRQKNKIARGGVIFERLALGPVLELRPEVAMTKQRPKGELTGRIDLARLPLSNVNAAQGKAELADLWLNYRDYRFRTLPVQNITLASGKLQVPELVLSAATPAGHTTTFAISGHVDQVGSNPNLDLELALQPVDLSTWAAVIPKAERVKGTLKGSVHLRGPWKNLRPEGGFALRGGELAIRGEDLTLDQIDVDLKLSKNKLSISQASANLNGGKITARGSAPLRGVKLGGYRGVVHATGVRVPTDAGIKLTVDASLDTTWQPSEPGAEAELPKVQGEVSIKSFEYTRAVTMNAELADLARRGRRTQFESYDPSQDKVELDMLVTSQKPLRLSNNLIDTQLSVEKPGLRLTGTNQRFGLQGRLKVIPGGHIRLRRNEFEIQSGEIRFDDATQIAPRVDVTAVTDYRRYSSGGSATEAAATPGSAAGSTAAGDWRISMHAHGDAENLKLDLTSQPKLSQDDIFLLLTVGLTRAELDQAQSASVGESVALEALGSLTGADAAVTDAVPVIDEFKFGSSYSSRTGRTEPTVTIGKRLTERIRAFVTSGLSESREVRSNLEWRLNRGVSVEGSYDNVNDISSSGLGNLGADVRWRLEFE